MSMLEDAKSLEPDLIAWRRQLHQIPETGIHLPKTVAFVTNQLDAMGVPYQVMEESSNIVAMIGSGSKCFLLRSDMDALPGTEESGLDFASSNGCMHGCGHDLHCTILLGAAKLLKARERELSGVVKLLFQSGEETFQGAQEAVKAGVLKNPDVNAAFALHVFAGMEKNTILYGPCSTAAVYGFQITLTGRGGHGSQPENCIDPINAGVQVYLALQSLLAREIPACAEAVLTIGQFQAGTANNVIPERAVLSGTLRTFDKDITEYLIKRINEAAQSVATAYRTTAQVETLSRCPSVICDSVLTEELAKSVGKINPNLTRLSNTHMTGSEDFAFISEHVPASYFIIGAGVDDKRKWVDQHNPKILFNEDVLANGAAIYAQVAMDWLDDNC